MNARDPAFFTPGERHFPPIRPRVAQVLPEVPAMIDMDGINIFLMFVPLLFLAQLGTYGALLFVFFLAIHVLRHRRCIRDAFRFHAPFLIFPAYAILSTFWSEAPAETLRHSLEFALTVMAAILLARVRNRRSMMFALFAAFACYCAASLLFGHTVAVGDTTGRALSGLSDSKNEEASTDVIGAIISLAWLLLGFKTRRYLQCLIALPVLAMEMYAGVLARSAGALIALAVGLFLLVLLAALTGAGRKPRALFVGLGGVSALTLALLFMTFTGPIVDFLSNWFGKDTTLTGRTYLWARARDLIVEQPILGRGFSAFWQQGNLDAEGLWQFAHINSRTGFNFHNASYDLLVSLGWVGLLLFLVTLTAGLARTAGAYVRQPSLLAAFWLAIGASMIVRFPIETFGTYEFSFATILLFASFTYVSAADQAKQALEARTAWPTGTSSLSMAGL